MDANGSTVARPWPRCGARSGAPKLGLCVRDGHAAAGDGAAVPLARWARSASIASTSVSASSSSLVHAAAVGRIGEIVGLVRAGSEAVWVEAPDRQRPQAPQARRICRRGAAPAVGLGGAGCARRAVEGWPETASGPVPRRWPTSGARPPRRPRSRARSCLPRRRAGGRGAGNARARSSRRRRRPGARHPPPSGGAVRRRAPARSRSRPRPHSRCRSPPGPTFAPASSSSSASARTRIAVGISCSTPSAVPLVPRSRRITVDEHPDAQQRQPSQPARHVAAERLFEARGRLAECRAVREAHPACVVVGGDQQRAAPAWVLLSG